MKATANFLPRGRRKTKSVGEESFDIGAALPVAAQLENDQSRRIEEMNAVAGLLVDHCAVWHPVELEVISLAKACFWTWFFQRYPRSV